MRAKQRPCWVIGSLSFCLESLETLLTEKGLLTVRVRELHVLIKSTLDLVGLEAKARNNPEERESECDSSASFEVAENCETAIILLICYCSERVKVKVKVRVRVSL